MFNNINDKERQLLEENRNTVDCPINTFYQAYNNIMLVKINEFGDFIFIFDDGIGAQVKRGIPPMQIHNLKPLSEIQVRTKIADMKTKVAGDWYQLLLLDTALHILDENREPLNKQDEAWLTR